MSRGTPKTLRQAVQNGIHEFELRMPKHGSSKKQLNYCIRIHVVEFLDNKLASIMLATEDEKVLKAIDKMVDAIKIKF